MKKIRKKTVAKGCIDPTRPGQLKFQMYLDEETFSQVRGRAIKNNTSFAEEVRTLVEWGLEAERAEA